MLTLPPVAKSFSLECKKCNTERYHRVLAHLSPTSAKVECEICGSKKTYKLPKEGKKRQAPRVKNTEASRAKAHEQEYQQLLDSAVSQMPTPYSMSARFTVNQKLQHPKFGIGMIRLSYPDKIEVIFLDQVRMLIHNK